MTFPDIVNATASPVAAGLGFVVALVLAWLDKGLFAVSVSACATVFILELFLA
jgi:hypothetical protein